MLLGKGEPMNMSMAAALTNAVVAVLRRHTGRGPTKAHTTITPTTVVVTLRDYLSGVELSLAGRGEAEAVSALRRAFHRDMSADLIAAVEDVTGRAVEVHLGASTIEPDIAVEIFVMRAHSAHGDGESP